MQSESKLQVFGTNHKSIRAEINGQTKEVQVVKSPPVDLDQIQSPTKLESVLSELDDDLLVHYGRQLQERSFENWIRQCCVAHILISRQEGWASRLAAEWGVTRTWVYELAYVWRKIIVPVTSQGEAIPPLPPSFFHEALRAPDPIQAIKEADDAKSLNPRFSVRQFRRAIAAKKRDSDHMVESCKHCRYFQILKGVPFRVMIEGKTYDLVGTIKACRHQGILQINLDWDPEATAENCSHFWGRSEP